MSMSVFLFWLLIWLHGSSSGGTSVDTRFSNSPLHWRGRPWFLYPVRSINVGVVFNFYFGYRCYLFWNKLGLVRLILPYFAFRAFSKTSLEGSLTYFTKFTREIPPNFSNAGCRFFYACLSFPFFWTFGKFFSNIARTLGCIIWHGWSKCSSGKV